MTHSGSGIDRRTLLATIAGTGAFGIALAHGVPVVLAQEPRVHRLTFGAFEITILSDGQMVLPVSTLAPDVAPDALAAALRDAGLPTDRRVAETNVTLIRRGEETVLVDTGGGMNFMDTLGRLTDSFSEAGIEPSSVSRVVLTHAHPDHVWGVIDDFEEAERFAEADYVIGEAEWAFWMAEDALSKVPETLAPFVLGAQRNLSPVAGKTERARDGAEVMPGVRLVATPGHTPGHMSVMLESEGRQLFVTGDCLTHPVVSFATPEWRFAFDQDPEQAITTRRRILDMLAADDVALIGYHLPWPGLGRVERAGDGAYRYRSTV